MPFRCQLCGKGYLSRRGLSHHMALHEGKTFECPVCGREMNTKGNMKKHLRRIHKSDQCARCMQMFSVEELQLHIQTCQVGLL